ncbi:MAG: hypothetical protein L0H65_02450 [Pseudorhodobacter sp.]|nr:hypothetical protein [Pseudorhodobacter sp.]MDN5785896.1 hypothetical protein [Pseudorhodobacter sp.]
MTHIREVVQTGPDMWKELLKFATSTKPLQMRLGSRPFDPQDELHRGFDASAHVKRKGRWRLQQFRARRRVIVNEPRLPLGVDAVAQIFDNDLYLL